MRGCAQVAKELGRFFGIAAGRRDVDQTANDLRTGFIKNDLSTRMDGNLDFDLR
jgi:hypothetical protein